MRVLTNIHTDKCEVSVLIAHWCNIKENTGSWGQGHAEDAQPALGAKTRVTQRSLSSRSYFKYQVSK